ncbi:ATP-dependent DNA helicase PIF2-like [Mytilus californianus]|uniref:ATP-dependent DNA helicase PIF2-like n=1 Tax=Mytilus californianus TaxID=6549 RepID=UPI002246F90E|nr:ATP-dependent DNA helicase PIF2-like [Mytilus californianus]
MEMITQCLIIDKISMLSRKLFEQLEFVCRNIPNSSLIFGGKQVIVVVDFFQLPPVPDYLKMDSGEYYMNSKISQIQIKQETFTVFSYIDSKVIASRRQFHSYLAFTITIHKAQGLTLDRVECSY